MPVLFGKLHNQNELIIPFYYKCKLYSNPVCSGTEAIKQQDVFKLNYSTFIHCVAIYFIRKIWRSNSTKTTHFKNLSIFYHNYK